MKPSFSIAICEAVILSNGNQSKIWYSDISQPAARFAYSSVLILTGLICSFLTCSPKKRTTNFFCFLLAVASLVLASYGSSRLTWPQFWSWHFTHFSNNKCAAFFARTHMHIAQNLQWHRQILEFLYITSVEFTGRASWQPTTVAGKMVLASFSWIPIFIL